MSEFFIQSHIFASTFPICCAKNDGKHIIFRLRAMFLVYPIVNNAAAYITRLQAKYNITKGYKNSARKSGTPHSGFCSPDLRPCYKQYEAGKCCTHELAYREGLTCKFPWCRLKGESLIWA